MKHIIFTLAVLLFWTGCSLKSAKDYFNESERLAKTGQYEESIKKLNRAIELDSDYIGAYINRGADKSALGRYQEAIEDYYKVLQLDSSNTLALFNIGNNYEKLDRYNDALTYFNAAFESKGGQGFYINHTPNDLDDSHLHDVDGSVIHFERGIIYYNLDSLTKSHNDFKAALNAGYNTGHCYYWLGHVFKASGQKKEACYYFGLAHKHRIEDLTSELEYCK